MNRNAAGTGLADGAFGQLWALSVKSKTRELKLGSAPPFGASVSELATIPVRMATISPGVLKIVPAAPLPPGEYAFLAPNSWGGVPPTKDKIGEFFCFGVDPD